jgi:hypothetical protein
VALSRLKLTRAAPSPANASRAEDRADPREQILGATGEIQMVSVCKNLAQDDNRATAIEYGLIAALIAIAAIGAGWH